MMRGSRHQLWIALALVDCHGRSPECTGWVSRCVPVLSYVPWSGTSPSASVGKVRGRVCTLNHWQIRCGRYYTRYTLSTIIMVHVESTEQLGDVAYLDMLRYDMCYVPRGPSFVYVPFVFQSHRNWKRLSRSTVQTWLLFNNYVVKTFF